MDRAKPALTATAEIAKPPDFHTGLTELLVRACPYCGSEHTHTVEGIFSGSLKAKVLGIMTAVCGGSYQLLINWDLDMNRFARMMYELYQKRSAEIVAKVSKTAYKKQPQEEQDKRHYMWDLHHLAGSAAKAAALEANRTDYFNSLYDFSSTYTDYEDPVGICRHGVNTESKALEIIDEKDAYDRLIKSYKAKAKRWQSILSRLPPFASVRFRNYFEHGLEDPNIESLVVRLFPELQREEEEQEKVKNQKAYAAYHAYRQRDDVSTDNVAELIKLFRSTVV
ncbi:hypothetical protein [Domibacillus tundrae]|uniref:hypothetical protein n=1 Tax=Domibacillus tundrae TaxID=1587527 RepID=UPI000617E170|nr:hypothetical protein [Domibacillus tundrae]